MACPHVSGAAALVLEADPRAQQITAVLEDVQMTVCGKLGYSLSWDAPVGTLLDAWCG